ncbi:MAG: alkaline phosphatase family protein [Gammaproteobacteria bacterium]|nr:alkaline phosphatase family protein [Gammaproteobacteria bacterium]
MNVSTLPSLVVINVVGLTPGIIGEHTPHLNTLIGEGCMRPVSGVFPAVTTSVQAAMVTGKTASEHGIVGNGWYWRDLAEVKFWLQPDQLVQSQKIWERLKQKHDRFVCSRLFWWNNMYADVDYSVTPRPHYHADGSKEVDLYSSPSDLHQRLQAELGSFPFFNFWGPKANILSTQWIAEAAALEFKWNRPNLQFVYLPHLDYNLQRLGPEDPNIWKDVREIDRVAGQLITQMRNMGAEVLVVSEYGITQVSRPIHINRLLREHGYLQFRQSSTWELLDCGASRAFAVADHQIAHIYINNNQDIPEIKELLESCEDIDAVLCQDNKQAMGINHPRSGELIAIANPNAWFTYYFWKNDAKAPDFARTVDIHRKPGYDPVELFVDPQIPLPSLKVAQRLTQKKLGMRMLMDVIGLDATLVKGSHGRLASSDKESPVLISSIPGMLESANALTDVESLIFKYFDEYSTS